MQSCRTLRSLLCMPGDRPEYFSKAAGTGSDAVVLDLEDPVAPGHKQEARAAVAAELAKPSEQFRFVRINHPHCGQLALDLTVLGSHGPQGIMVPKVSCGEDLEDLDNRLTTFERERNLDPRAIALLVIIETCRGLRNLFEILHSHPRVRGAGLATAEEGDLMLDLGGRWDQSGTALAYARGKFVCDARAAGLDWIVDGAFMHLVDNDALETETRIARTCGFNGKVAIHPRQVTRINSVFNPTPEEIQRATHIIQAYQTAEQFGRGVIRVDGLMVDRANVRWAEQILSATRESP